MSVLKVTFEIKGNPSITIDVIEGYNEEIWEILKEEVDKTFNKLRNEKQQEPNK